MIFFILRIKFRSNEEKENDLFNEKIFDLTIELKEIRFSFPQHGLSNSFVLLIKINSNYFVFYFILKSIRKNSSIEIDISDFILRSCLNENHFDKKVFIV